MAMTSARPAGRLGDRSYPSKQKAVTGSANVLINDRPALREEDLGTSRWRAIQGANSVLINGRPAHRMRDQHSASELCEGSPNTLIGDVPADHLPSKKPFQSLRLPIGEENAQKDPGGCTKWTFWIPTKLGGLIRLVHSSSNILKMPRKNGATLSRVGTLNCVLAHNEYGEFTVYSIGKPGNITCYFSQTGWARQNQAPDSEPLIPWNFHYWPYHKSEEAAEVIERYCTAQGIDGVHHANWEKNHHHGSPGKSWEGHCLSMAIASVVFENPKNKTIRINDRNTIEFSGEDIELLAGELCATYLFRAITRWYLNSKSPENPNMGGPMGNEYSIKPSDVGKELDNVTRIAMGKLGASFFDNLTHVLRQFGYPIISNLRCQTQPSDPTSIWNYAIFYYKAIFSETASLNDNKDISIICHIYANYDFLDPKSADPPARAVSPRGEYDDRLIVEENGLSNTHNIHSFRIIFDEAGNINNKSERNCWNSVEVVNKDGARFTNFAPEVLQVIPASSIKTLDKKDLENKIKWPAREFKHTGNPGIGLELINKGYVRLNHRYGMLFKKT